MCVYGGKSINEIISLRGGSGLQFVSYGATFTIKTFFLYFWLQSTTERAREREKRMFRKHVYRSLSFMFLNCNNDIWMTLSVRNALISNDRYVLVRIFPSPEIFDRQMWFALSESIPSSKVNWIEFLIHGNRFPVS